ncbi:MAG: helix-turn-helix domain-containing protein [Candidatus Omnitrophica bacterium]|nr:helix-turn-helix domain-containing protein [Candidatus Omnitrophota bacterium]
MDHQKHKVMTAKEVSEFFKIPLFSVWDLTRKGKIRGVKIGKHWRYLEEDIRTYLSGSWVRSSHLARPSQNRIFPRINCDIPARLKVSLSYKSTICKQGMICNLGEGGLLIVHDRRSDPNPTYDTHATDLRIGDPVEVIFEIPDMIPSPLCLKGRVVHQSWNTHAVVGIKFRGLLPEQQEVIRNYVG